MNKVPNRQAICETLMEHAKTDRDITVLCSDSRGSASLTPFFNAYPDQAIEVGIAEQNLVSISAGLASCGKKPWCASPASFVTTRSYEQCKVDVAYSDTNVKIIGIIKSPLVKRYLNSLSYSVSNSRTWTDNSCR